MFCPPQTIPSILPIFHPNWTGVKEDGYDLALLKLQRDSCLMFPIELAPEDFEFPDPANTTYLFAAFGRDDELGAFSLQLQAGDWRIIPNDECQANFTQPGTVITDQMLCARGAATPGLCQGTRDLPDSRRGYRQSSSRSLIAWRFRQAKAVQSGCLKETVSRAATRQY